MKEKTSEVKKTVAFNADEYNVDKQLKFGEFESIEFKLTGNEAEAEKKKGKKESKANYWTAKILSDNLDGSIGQPYLTFGSSQKDDGKFGGLQCYGVKSFSGPKYSCSISMMDRKNPTDKEKKGVETLKNLTQKVKEYIAENRKTFKSISRKLYFPKDNWGVEDLSNTDLLSYKTDENGETDKSATPSCFFKLIYYNPKSDKKEKGKKGKKDDDEEPEGESDEKPEGKFGTSYYEVDISGDPVMSEETGKQIEIAAMDLIDKWHLIMPVIKFETIYVSPTYQKIQAKIYDAEVYIQPQQNRRLVNNKREFKPDSGKVVIAKDGDSLKELMKGDDTAHGDKPVDQKAVDALVNSVEKVVLSDDESEEVKPRDSVADKSKKKKKSGDKKKKSGDKE